MRWTPTWAKKPRGLSCTSFERGVEGHILRALESYAVDHLRLRHLDGDGASCKLDMDIPEEARCEERPHALVGFRGVVALPGLEPEVLLDGLGVDAVSGGYADLADYGTALRVCTGRPDSSRPSQRCERKENPKG